MNKLFYAVIFLSIVCCIYMLVTIRNTNIVNEQYSDITKQFVIGKKFNLAKALNNFLLIEKQDTDKYETRYLITYRTIGDSIHSYYFLMNNEDSTITAVWEK